MRSLLSLAALYAVQGDDDSTYLLQTRIGLASSDDPAEPSTELSVKQASKLVIKGHPEKDGTRKFHCVKPNISQLDEGINVKNHDIATVCCNDKGEGFRPSCDWHDITQSQATFNCESKGLRLCTGAELAAGAGQTVKSGLDKSGPYCKYDGHYIWTSTTCIPDPCTTSALVIKGDWGISSVGAKQWQCAPQDDTRLGPEINVVNKEFATICCNSAGEGFRPSCDWHDVSQAGARARCKSVGLDLCSAKQIKKGVGQTVRSGLDKKGPWCMYDGYFIWTDSACIPEKCTQSMLVVKGKHEKNGKRKYSCVKAGDTQFDVGAKFPINKEFATVCCNDKGEGFRPSCEWHQVSQPQAEGHCKSVGLRLCTAQEIHDGAGQTVKSGLKKDGPYCKYDGYFIWSSSTCMDTTNKLLKK